MKKALFSMGSLAYSANRLQYHSFTSLHRLRLACYSSAAPDNLAFDKSDLNLTEIDADEKIQRKDSVLRAADKTLLLNSTVNWASNADDGLAEEVTDGVEKRKKRSATKKISFKISKNKLFSKNPAAEKLWIRLQDTGFAMNTLFEMILQNPEITTFNPDLVASNVTQLIKLGFKNHEIKAVVGRYPEVLEYEGYDVYDTFETWRAGGLFELFLIELFTRHPRLFALPNEEIKFRLSRLNYLLGNKINRMTAILKRTPNIMDGDWSRVEENFEYLYRTMRVTEKEISRSKGLTLALPFIVLRREFLERCGIYVRPSLKEKGGGFDEHKNPPLSQILDTSDEIFAMNVAKVSLDEYLVFKKLMKFDETKGMPDEDSLDTT